MRNAPSEGAPPQEFLRSEGPNFQEIGITNLSAIAKKK